MVEEHHNFLACSRSLSAADLVLSNCHHIAAETFSTIFDKVTTKYAMGISATVSRKDGLTKVLHHHLGPLVVDVQSDTNDRTATVFVLDYDVAPAGRTPVEKITSLVVDERRNSGILVALERLCQQDQNNERKLLVLSERREHAASISRQLTERAPGKSVGLYLGGMKNEVLEVEKNKDIVCSTYTMFGEGISVKQLNTLIMLTPKSDVCQIMGRIFRQRHSLRAWIVDIVDPGSEGKFRSRLRTYKTQLSDMEVRRCGLRDEMNWASCQPV
jgi:superfamily II DNA or RNA helicase